MCLLGTGVEDRGVLRVSAGVRGGGVCSRKAGCCCTTTVAIGVGG